MDFIFDSQSSLNSLENSERGGKATFTGWSRLPLFILFFGVFGILITAVIKVQVFDSSEYVAKAQNNSLTLRYIYPNRGIIYDRNGEILAENIPATDLYLNITRYSDDSGKLDKLRLQNVVHAVTNVLGDSWKEPDSNYDTLENKIFDQYRYMSIYLDLSRISNGGHWTEINANKIDTFLNENAGKRWVALNKDNGQEGAFRLLWREVEDLYYQKEVSLARNISNEQTIKIKSLAEDYDGLRVDEATKRYYPKGDAYSHILGYTGAVYQEEWANLDYVGLNDIIGKTGIEKVYDRKLIGEKGLYAYETDARGNILTDEGRIVSEPVSGSNLYLTIDSEAQEKMHEMLGNAVSKYGAVGAVGIVQDVENGELLVLDSYPSYDNNDFIEGISAQEYKALSNTESTPLLNRAIAAQLPPGSTFKTLAAVGALDSGAINTGTVYVSRSDYKFSNGSSFQEYKGHAYGPLNVKQALMMSSNIFFCETIRNWDIDEYVKYLDAFGIGKITGIDLIGEAPGRLPSPANKIALAKLPAITWLDPIWYPEGDSCNTVIGQGITLTTPIQMSNWISAIANGGTLNTPHLLREVESKDSDGNTVIDTPTFDILNSGMASSSSMQIVREGMRLSIVGDRSQNFAMRSNKAEVAAKTGTAEFGALDAKGIYEHTHAWITGFWPYSNPKYAFTILLQDGGGSYNASAVANEFTNWWVERE